jgi:HAE1 family hydrophobic/amphiphilic exporter-1
VVPIGFMYGLSGQWFKPFALTIACAVLVSLFVSFSLDPMLSAYWADPHKEEHEKGPITRTLDKFNRWFDRMTEGYTSVVGWALDHRKSMVFLALLSFVGALVLQGTIGGAGFVPVADRSEFEAIVESPPSANLAYTMSVPRRWRRCARTPRWPTPTSRRGIRCRCGRRALTRRRST